MKKKTFALGAALLSLSALTLGGIAGQLSNTYAIDARAEGDDSGETVTDGPHTGVDMFVSEGGTLSWAAETSSIVGQIYYWHENGDMTSPPTYDKENNTLTCEYTQTGYWYGFQLFYYAPYNDVVSNFTSWEVTATIESTVSGIITVNGSEITLTTGTPYSLSVNPQANNATLDIQFGYYNGDAWNTPLASGTVVFKDIKIIDPTNAYYLLTFLDDQSNVIDSIYTLSGQTAWTIPTAPEAEGKTFLYWKDGNETTYTASEIANLVPQADMTLTAVYQDSDATVTYYVGETEIETINAAQGGYLSAPSYGYDECGFGYGVAGWYTDKDLTNEWDFSQCTVSAEHTDLYAKLWIENSATYSEWSADIASSISHGDDGSLIYSGVNGVGGQAYYTQINFDPVPVGKEGIVYELSFDYKINYEITAQIYGDTDYAVATLAACDDWTTVTMTYEGGTISDSTKLTFEFGAVPTTTTIDFALKNITITEKSFEIAAFVPTTVSTSSSAYVKLSTNESYIEVTRVELGETAVEINYNDTVYYIYTGTIETPTEYSLTDGAFYTIAFATSTESTYGTGLTATFDWDDLIFMVPGDTTGTYALVEGDVDDINAAVDYLSGTLYSNSWRDTNGSICWLTTNTSDLNQLLTDYDALDEDVRYWADMFVDYGVNNSVCTYGETIAYLANFDVDTSSETLSIFGDSDSATMIAMIVLISAAAILGLGGVLIYKRRHNAA